MVLELLAQDWRTNGSSTVALALGRHDDGFLRRSDPALAYGEIVSRLTGAMDPVASSVLDLASVLGHRLNDLTMYSVVDLSLGQTMVALRAISGTSESFVKETGLGVRQRTHSSECLFLNSVIGTQGLTRIRS